MDQKMSDPPSSSPKLLTFDALVANDFIVKKDETKGVPTLQKVKHKFSKKRKSRSSESTGSNTSILAAGENKRSIVYDSPSLGTPTTQMKPQPPASPAPMLSHKGTDHLLMIVGRLKKEAAAIVDRIIPSVVPDAQDRLLLTQRVVALQQVFIQLNEYAQVDASHSAPEDLWRIEGLLLEATVDFRERIRTSLIPDAINRLFFVEAVSALLQVLLKL